LVYDKAKIVQHRARLAGTKQEENDTQNLAGELSMFDLHDIPLTNLRKTGPPSQRKKLNYWQNLLETTTKP